MIVSHRHRFIFVATPKTGTHAVRQALRPHLGPEDIEQVGLFVQKQFPFPDLARIGHGHLGIEEVRPYLGNSAVDAYFKFAFVRNPYDRFVSYCAFMTRREGSFERNPRAVMRHFLFELRPLQHVHFRPQYLLLADSGGRLLTDMLGRVETMQASWEAICARIGIPAQTLERVNGSRHGDYTQYYDAELREGVQALYRRDFELFGYAP